jgi:acetolactate synthase-1/2/3 large subunit
VLAVEKAAGKDAIYCGGAGNYMVWYQRFTRFRTFRSQMGSTSGSMGYGIPAAVVSKLVHPERPVVAYTGDGCLMMTVQELAAVAKHNLNILVLVSNNGMFGTIRMHQEREFPGRPAGTSITNPDFVQLGKAFGFEAERIERTDQIGPALKRWTESGTAMLLELLIDPDVSTPRLRLSDLQK